MMSAVEGRRQAPVGQCYIIGSGQSWVKIAGGLCHQGPAYQVVSRARGDINRCSDIVIIKLTFCLLFCSSVCVSTIWCVGSNNLAQILSNDNEMCQGQNYF